MSQNNNTNNKPPLSPGAGLFAGLSMSHSIDDSIETPVVSNVTTTISSAPSAENIGQAPPAPSLTPATQRKKKQHGDAAVEEEGQGEKKKNGSSDVKKEEDAPASPSKEAATAASAAAQPSPVEKDDDDGKEKASLSPGSPPLMNEDEARQELDSAFQQTVTPDNAKAAGPPEEEAVVAPPKASSATANQQEVTATTTATNNATTTYRHVSVHPDSMPIPHGYICLRLLRKFAYKTRPKILKEYGGSLSRSLLSYIGGAFSTNKQDLQQQEATFHPYKELLDCIFEPHEDRDAFLLDDTESSERSGTAAENSSTTLNNNNYNPDSDDRDNDPSVTERANRAVGIFVDLFAIWGHASSALMEKKDKKAIAAFADLQVCILDAASSLAAYGCLDHVKVVVTSHNGGGDEVHMATEMLASSVFNSDLSLEKVELAAMKFLLGTGCHQNPSLLRGSYLLQSIRTLYHVYLTTESKSNKVTARAALQQLVTSVFAKVVQTDTEASEPVDMFPSDDHKDAFLVLRSICKLSMRSLPDHENGNQMHIGLQTSASNDTWDGNERLKNHSDRGSSTLSGGGSNHSDPSSNRRQETAALVYTSAIHPALESKLLALELILYVLQNTDFSGSFIQHCGSQFHAAIRNYLCVSLLKNCTSDNTRVVNLSLRIFVPVVRNFRTVLKNEIEAFVTNVFFVILDSKNSPAEHKSLVVNTFNEICSDPNTLAEIFLNYDCDLSAVDLFHRIVNTLSRLSRTGLQESFRSSSGMSSLMGGPSESQMEKSRNESRELRLDAMRALRQVLASLHASIVEPMNRSVHDDDDELPKVDGSQDEEPKENGMASPGKASPGKQNLVEIYGSKKKRRAEESEAVLRFNQKPSAGIAYAAKCKHIDAEDPTDVARYLLKNKDEFDKTQIGEYLGREADYQGGFSIRVLHEYARLMDFEGLVFDDAIRFFLSGFRLPGEAQKIDRIMEKFAERFTEQNPSVFPSADVAFILSFSIIMLNTDLHNPAIKEERRMTKEGFVRNNRGICDGQDLPEELLTAIFDRIKANPISLKEDDEARERVGDPKQSSVTGLPAALNPKSFFSSHYNDANRARETNFQKERDHIVRTTESLLKRRRHGGDQKQAAKARTGKNSNRASRFVLSGDSGLRDEYVSPMFEVTWCPALAAFSTAMESANGTVGALISIASDEELELAAENAAETIEVCLTGFRFAIGIAGLCGNSIARDAYMLALSRFSQLGTGVLLEPRHLRCVQTMLSLAREDGELLGGSWEHVFKALSEINRFHQLFHLMARNDRAAALAADRRRKRLEAKEQRRQAREASKAAAEDGDSIGGGPDTNYLSDSDDEDSLAESGLFTDDEDFEFEENMDAKAIDEANAREIYDAVSEATIEAIYERSSSLSAPAVKEFVVQLCLVSRAEISVGANDKTDLTQVAYREKHALLSNADAHAAGDQFHHTQPNIYNLQKLVEVTHYNMASRPRLLFADLWVVVADHLTDTALHANPAIAMYAVDSFRQLSIQYLQRDELEVFEFQRRFLKPLETVMARSEQSSTKELLLNCIARLMHVFGTGSGTDSPAKRRGGLRSGWVPILIILGLGGRDADETIAEMSFKTLSGEIEQCLNDNRRHDVLLSEHFVETVDALLQIIGGPHGDISIQAIEQLVTLTVALDEGKLAPQMVKRKSSAQVVLEQDDECSKQKLDCWWPVLLGLSRAVGDSRHDVRSRALNALFGMINYHFFPSEDVDEMNPAWETLQLIFRGVLNSVLEFAEASDAEPAPSLPEDFELILSEGKDQKGHIDKGQDAEETGWLETTFDAFMDACVALCLRSVSTRKNSVLVEEVFALLNSCLISDSGTLAVRGLRRLEQFVTSDLDTAFLSDEIWATVSHMLQRCLTVRGLPKKEASDGSSQEESKEIEAEYLQSVKEFMAEDQFLLNRRYVGSNAIMVVGMLLCSDRFSIGLKWRLFLVKWLNRGVREWDLAAEILASADPKRRESFLAGGSRPPDYRETALYGRKWLNRLVLQLASIREIAQAAPDADPKSNRFAQGQRLVVDLTEALLSNFVKKEEIASRNRHTKVDEAIYKRYVALVNELLSGYGNMDTAHLQQMSWISPVLLSSCIRSKNEEIRLMVQRLVGKTSPASATVSSHHAPPPAPQRTEKDIAASNNEAPEAEQSAASTNGESS